MNLRIYSFFAFLCFFLFPSVFVFGDEPRSSGEAVLAPASYLNSEAYLYVEVNETTPLFESFLESTLWHNLQNHPLYEAQEETGVENVLKTVRYVENQTKQTLTSLLSTVLGKQMAFALYEKNKKPTWIFVAHHQSVQTTQRLLEALVQLAFMATKMKKVPEFQEYQGLMVLKVPKLIVSLGKEWLAISPDEDLLREFYERSEWKTRGTSDALASTSAYSEAQGTRKAGQIFAYARYRDILTRLKKDKIFTQKPDQPLLTLLFGNLIHALQNANVLSVSGAFEPEGTFSLRASYPLTSTPAEPYQFAYPEYRTSQFLAPQNGLLFAIEIHRDLGKWWGNREVLHEKNLIPKFVEFHTIMGQIFGGIDITEDLFGKTLSDIRFLGVPVEVEQGKPSPYLPGFVLMFKVENPDEFERNFRVGFQNGIGIINFERAKKDKEAMLICSEKVGKTSITGARWLDPQNAEVAMDIQYNFSPCIARQGETFYLSTSLEGLRSVLQRGLVYTALPDVLDHFYLSGSELYRILKKNEEQILWNKTVELGGNETQARTEIALLFDIIRQFPYLEMQTFQNAGRYSIEARTTVQKLDYAEKSTQKSTESDIQQGEPK
jgi:hypothetical protein